MFQQFQKAAELPKTLRMARVLESSLQNQVNCKLNWAR